ncbi:MAG TPA: ribonuclease III [Dokdonella sp.]
MTNKPILGHRFADAVLLERALTHRSAGQANNERLEFLGDALVNLFVAELIYERHPRADEGEMTRLRAALVNGSALAEVARAEELGERLRLGPGELKSGGYRRDSILADAFEALVAAIYVDAGWQACRAVVRRLFEARVAAAAQAPKDAKTRLQELLQGRNLALPVYELVAVGGEDHARTFDVACRVDALAIATSGSGTSRRAAEQIAAERALADAERAFADEH